MPGTGAYWRQRKFAFHGKIQSEVRKKDKEMLVF